MMQQEDRLIAIAGAASLLLLLPLLLITFTADLLLRPAADTFMFWIIEKARMMLVDSVQDNTSI
jgi:hypothetical protein